MRDPERALRCAACRAAIPPDHAVYTMRIDLFAEARPPEFDDADLVADTAGEWQRLMAELGAMDPAAVEEETAKVHERHEFRLCGRCRQTFHEQLSRLGHR